MKYTIYCNDNDMRQMMRKPLWFVKTFSAFHKKLALVPCAVVQRCCISFSDKHWRKNIVELKRFYAAGLQAERSCELSLGMLKAESDTFSPPQSTSIGLHSLREMYTRACQRKCKTTIILKYKFKHFFNFIYKRSLNFSNTAVLWHKRRLFLSQK